MKKLVAFMRRTPKRTSAFVAMIAVAVIAPLALNAWGPSRDTFTMKNPAPYVTFNAITDNPDYGDERNFVRIKDAANTSAGGWSDEINVQSDKEYLVQMYVHNNAADNLNLVAKNVNAKFNVPATTGKSVQIDGFISSSNASPTQVWDQAVFNSDKNFNIAYVPGSAVYYNNKTGQGGVKLSDAIVTDSGATLGYELPLNGDTPGCFKYSGYVSFKVKAQVQKVTNFEMTKKVSKHGENKWVENYKAQPGEIVDFILSYKNTGEVPHDDVTFRDTLPAGLTYVNDKNYPTTWNNTSDKDMLVSGTKLVDGTGVNVGSYAPGANAWMIFSAKVNDNAQLPTCGSNVLKNVAKVNTGGFSIEDDATVTVDKYCEPQPKYTCDSLSVKKIERTKFEFSTKYTVENATFKSVTYVVRDASGKEVYRGTNNIFTSATAGKYTVESIVTVTVKGKDYTAPTGNCKAEFTIDQAPAPAITIDKKVNSKEHERVQVGEEFTYQLVVKNTGNVDLKNAMVHDDAPANVEFLSADKGTITDNKWSYTIADLKVGQSVTFAIKAKVTKYVSGTIKNTACVDTPDINGNPDDCDDATVETKKPGVSIDKKVDGVDHKQVALNQVFTYQLVVKNTGESDLKQVAVTDNAPAHVQFIAADKGTIVDNKWGYTIPELKVGQSVAFNITAKVVTQVEGAIKNTACVDAPAVPGLPDDCDDATVEVPTPETQACELDTKKIVTIKESDFNTNKYSKNLNDCAATPVIPHELPTTGVSESMMAFIGLGSLVASIGYYIASRRALGA